MVGGSCHHVAEGEVFNVLQIFYKEEEDATVCKGMHKIGSEKTVERGRTTDNGTIRREKSRMRLAG